MPEEMPSHLAETGKPPLPTGTPPEAATLGSLVRQLADDSRDLIHQEVELAKAELTHTVRSAATNGALIVGGAVLLIIALFVVTAFLVLGLGRLLGGQYWISSLIVSLAFALLGATLLFRGRRGLRHASLKPDESIESLRTSKAWLQQEAAELKHDLSS